MGYKKNSIEDQPDLLMLGASTNRECFIPVSSTLVSHFVNESYSVSQAQH